MSNDFTNSDKSLIEDRLSYEKFSGQLQRMQSQRYAVNVVSAGGLVEPSGDPTIDYETTSTTTTWIGCAIHSTSDPNLNSQLEHKWFRKLKTCTKK